MFSYFTEFRSLVFVVLLYGSFLNGAMAQSGESSSEASAKLTELYEKAEKALTSKKDFRTGRDYALKAFELAQNQKNYSFAAQVAYLLGQGYQGQRDEHNAEVWFKSAQKFAMTAQDPDLIIKCVSARSKLATRDGNYRRAYEIIQEAFDYFSKKGQSVGDQQRRIEVIRNNLRQEIQKLEAEKESLQAVLGNVSEDRSRLAEKSSQLEKDNSALSSRSQALEEEKEQIAATVDEKEANLASEAEARAQAEAKAKKREKELKKMKREKLEQQVIMREQDLALSEAQRDADRNRFFWIITLGGVAVLLILALLLFSRFKANQKAKVVLEEKNKLIDSARQRSDELLLNILPAPIADELKKDGRAKARRFETATVLFADFKGFTRLAEVLSPENLVNELDHCFKAFDFIISQYEIEKIKTVGDAYVCASGLTEHRVMPNDMIKAALEMQEFLRDYRRHRESRGLPYFEARIGIHTGPVVAGVVGVKKFAYDIWGETVNVAARMEAACEPGRVNISESTYNLVRYQYPCDHRGKLEAKNMGYIDMYYVRDAES